MVNKNIFIIFKQWVLKLTFIYNDNFYLIVIDQIVIVYTEAISAEFVNVNPSGFI